MLLLGSTGLVRVVTGAAITLDVHADYIDFDGSTVSPSTTSTNTAITTATTTTVVGSPTNYRNVKGLTLCNKHATSSGQVTVTHYDGTTTVNLISVSLGPGQQLEMDENGKWSVLDASGNIRTAVVTSLPTVPMTISTNTIIPTAQGYVVPRKFVVQSSTKLTIQGTGKLRVL